jgi:starvation-inducible DNA-binding protein
MTKPQPPKANIGLDENKKKAIVDLLQHLLADEYVLTTATKGAHWNVSGIHFSELHKFLEKQYQQLSEITDEVAERVLQLGYKAETVIGTYLKLTRLKDEAALGTAEELIKGLVDKQETLIRELRKDIDTIEDEYEDKGTSDFLTGVMEQHEQMAWMLRVHLA